MPASRLKSRYQDLSRQRDQPAMLTACAAPRSLMRVAPDHHERVQRALATALRAGISAEDAYPAVLRALALLGLASRPVHFMPLWVPFLVGTAFGLGMSGMSLLLADILGGERGPLSTITQMGWTGAIITASVFGWLFASVIRFQAWRARLPNWSEI
jgi:MFS family permease